MSAINNCSCPIVKNTWLSFLDDGRLVKVAKVAAAVFLAIAMVAAYTAGAPWFVAFSLFCLALVPLFRVGQSLSN